MAALETHPSLPRGAAAGPLSSLDMGEADNHMQAPMAALATGTSCAAPPTCWPGHTGPRASSTSALPTVQETLLVPRQLCQAHLQDLVQDKATISVCMLCVRIGLTSETTSTTCSRVQLTFRPNRGYVPVQGADTSPILGKRVAGWSIVEASHARAADVRPHIVYRDGRPFFVERSGAGQQQPQPLSTDKVLVLEVDMRPVMLLSAGRSAAPAAAPVPLVPNVPLFQGSRFFDATSCAHCGSFTSTLWRKGWPVPAMLGSPGVRGMAEVNLCNGCGLKWGRNPAVFKETIARTQGQPCSSMGEDAGGDENARPTSSGDLKGPRAPRGAKVGEGHKRAPSQRLLARAVRQHHHGPGQHGLDASDDEVTVSTGSMSTGVAHTGSQRGSRDLHACSRDAYATSRMHGAVAMQVEWPLLSAQGQLGVQDMAEGQVLVPTPVYMGPSYTGPTSCAHCSSTVSGPGWLRGWVVGLQPDPTAAPGQLQQAEPLYANLCYRCGQQYECNPVGFLSMGVAAGQPTTSSSGGEAGSQGGHPGQRHSRKRPSSHMDDIGQSGRDQYAGTGANGALLVHSNAARKAPRSTSSSYAAGGHHDTLQALPPGVWQVQQQQPMQLGTGGWELRDAQAYDAPVVYTLGDGTHEVQEPQDELPAQEESDEEMDEAAVADLLINAMRNQRPPARRSPPQQQIAAPAEDEPDVEEEEGRGTGPVASSVAAALKHASRPQQAAPSPAAAPPAVEIPVLSHQPLIVPDGLVCRHFPMARDASGSCQVRLVFMCAKQYLPSSQEWVRLVEHPATHQVRVEGASLEPLYGKVMVGWRALDGERAPAPQPIRQPDGRVWWLDPQCGLRVPLSTDKVLVLEVRETSAPLEVQLPLPVKPEHTTPASALPWTNGAAAAATAAAAQPSVASPRAAAPPAAASGPAAALQCAVSKPPVSAAVRSKPQAPPPLPGHWPGAHAGLADRMAAYAPARSHQKVLSGGKELHRISRDELLRKHALHTSRQKQTSGSGGPAPIPSGDSAPSGGIPPAGTSPAGNGTVLPASTATSPGLQQLPSAAAAPAGGAEHSGVRALPQQSSCELPATAASSHQGTAGVVGAHAGSQRVGPAVVTGSNEKAGPEERVGEAAARADAAPAVRAEGPSAASAARHALMRFFSAEEEGCQPATFGSPGPAALMAAVTANGAGAAGGPPGAAGGAHLLPANGAAVSHLVSRGGDRAAAAGGRNDQPSPQLLASMVGSMLGSSAAGKGRTPPRPGVATSINGQPALDVAAWQAALARSGGLQAVSAALAPRALPAASMPPLSQAVRQHTHGPAQPLQQQAGSTAAPQTRSPAGAATAHTARPASAKGTPSRATPAAGAPAPKPKPAAAAAAPAAAGPGAGDDLQGQVLDVLRPMVLGLRQHGGPTVSSVWAAVSGMSADELRSFQRHGLPWVQSLWEEQQWEECGGLLRQMLKVA